MSVRPPNALVTAVSWRVTVAQASMINAEHALSPKPPKKGWYYLLDSKYYSGMRSVMMYVQGLGPWAKLT